MAVSAGEILEWKYAGTVTKRIAAYMATQITSGDLGRFSELPDTPELAKQWDVTPRTVIRAKRLLYDGELIKKASSGRYYVAWQPAETAS
jgi:DNA-binding GntR family transcriptional regulator